MLIGSMRSMLNGGNLLTQGDASCRLRLHILQFCLKIVLSRLAMRWVLFDNLTIFGKGETKMILLPYQKFGEKCIVMNQEKLEVKVENHAIPCMWLGYANSDTISTHHVLNPKMKQVMLTKDEVLMKTSNFYHENENTIEEMMDVIEEMTNKKDNDEDNESTAGDPNVHMVSNDEDVENINNENEMIASNNNTATTNTKIIWFMRHLEISYNTEAKKVNEKAIEKANDSKAGRDIIFCQCN